jgi:hypothetical protein
MKPIASIVESVPAPAELAAVEKQLHLLLQKQQLLQVQESAAKSAGCDHIPAIAALDYDHRHKLLTTAAEIRRELAKVNEAIAATRTKHTALKAAHVEAVRQALAQQREHAVQSIVRDFHNIVEAWSALDEIDEQIVKAGGQPPHRASASQFQRLTWQLVAAAIKAPPR